MFKPIRGNRKKLSNLFHGQTQRLFMEKKYISALIFAAKYYLVGSKIILMALYFIILQTVNSSFRPLEQLLLGASNSPRKLCP